MPAFSIFRATAAIVFAFHMQTALGGDLFESHDILEIELSGPVAETIRSKSRRTPKTFKLSVGDKLIDVDVSVRGKSRVEYCRFPPLRLDFSNSDTDATPFSGERRLKLVTHCKATASYEQNVLEEYAAYRIFSMLSDVSLRVRLLRIRYVDTGKKRRGADTFYGFLIESEEGLAARVGGRKDRVKSLSKARLDTQQSARVFVFQYLVGNTDWGLTTSTESTWCCHNGAIIDIGGKHFFVPYDFDQSGFVSPPYAAPHPSLRIRNVRTRLYRGYCIEDLAIASTLTRTAEIKADMYSLIRSLPDATGKLTTKRLRYLDGFYQMLQEESGLAESMERSCIG